jgi:hypothetical protein
MLLDHVEVDEIAQWPWYRLSPVPVDIVQQKPVDIVKQNYLKHFLPLSMV